MAKKIDEEVSKNETFNIADLEKGKCFTTDPSFELIHGINAKGFIPEVSGRGGWILKANVLKANIHRPEDGVRWNLTASCSNKSDICMSYIIKTGLKYNDVFKRAHIVKTLPEHSARYAFFVDGNTVEIDGELAIVAFHRGPSFTIRQGDDVAEIIFV